MGLRLTLALSFAAFAAVLWQRNAIRAEFWCWKLTRTTDPGEQSYYFKCLASAGDDATTALCRLAGHPDPLLRMRAVRALEKLEGPAVLRTLRRRMEDDDVSVREFAAQGLSFRDSPVAQASLLDAARSAKADLAAAAVQALARLDREMCVPALCIAGLHEAALVRAQAVESLGTMLRSCEANMEAPWRREAVGAIVDRLEDAGLFEGQLSMERQIAAAAAYLRMNMAGPSLEIQGTPAPSSRTVGSFAMEMLVMLCDGPVKAAQRDERIEECLARMKERCLPQRRGGPDR